MPKLDRGTFSSGNLPASADCIAMKAARGHITQKRIKFKKVLTHMAEGLSILLEASNTQAL
jgi:hypothetical protein